MINSGPLQSLHKKTVNKVKEINKISRVKIILRSRTHIHTNIIIAFLFIVILGMLFYFSILFPVIPITDDEAFNYSFLSSRGPIYSLTNYPAANNHLFFTFLQSLTVPTIHFLRILPGLIRLLNVIIGASLFLFIYLVFCRITKARKNYLLIVIALIVFFISPLTTIFYVIARGYLLGALLLLIGIFFLSTNRFYISAIFLILSGWTLPTYIYCFPLLYVAAFIFGKNNRRHVILSAITVLLGLYLCYRPIMSQLFVQSVIWNTNYSYSNMLYEIWLSLTNFSYLTFNNIGNFLYFILYVFSFIFIIRNKYPSTIKKLILYLACSILSYLLVACVLYLLFISNPPFLRNALFIPIFIVVSMLFAALIIPKRFAIYLWLILTANTIVGSYFFITKLPYNQNNQYPILADYTSPEYFHFPLSSRDEQLLRENKLKVITLSDPLSDTTVAEYFSQIYSVPIKDLRKNTSTLRSVKSSLSSQQITPDIEPKVFILPTNPLYMVKTAYENFLLKLLVKLSNYENRRSKLITYLLSLSNTQYAQGDQLIKKGNYTQALSVFANGNSTMALAIYEVKQLYLNEGDDPTKIQELQSANVLHLSILKKNLLHYRGQYAKQLTAITSQEKQDSQIVYSMYSEK